MEQKNLYDQSISIINDDSFNSLIKAFSEETNSPSINFEKFTDLLYTVLKRERGLFLQKSSLIQLKKLKLVHILKVQKQMQLLVNQHKLEHTDFITILNYLNKFCTFLRKKEIANLYYMPPKLYKTASNEQLDDAIILKFVNYMKMNQYAATTIHHFRTSLKYFLTHSNYQNEKEHTNHFWYTCIIQFENYLSQEVVLEKIKTCTAYGYLKAVRLFSQFLSAENLISFNYTIPKKLIQNGNRSNEYVAIQDVLSVIKEMFEHSKTLLRDISILLIIFETGCRPIEIANLNIDDIYLNEKLIVLKSKKSKQRTLCLTETTVSFLKQYLQIRENFSPEANMGALFLTTSGNPLSSNFISQLFRKYNLKTFKENRFTPKTLRHTFITNALNNEIDIDQVRESVGHKHLISTHYYFYRDINHMKSLFLNKQLF